MAVYKRRYESYLGPITRRWPRCLVLTRYALGDMFRSRFFFICFVICLLPVLGFGGYIYVVNSDLFRTLFHIRLPVQLSVGPKTFAGFLQFQSSLGFLLTCWACPTLIAGDLTNGALPLFLSRPIRREEYVAGKFAVLAVLLSCLTWIPAVGLLFLQGGLTANGWLGSNVWMIGPILWCSLAWITLLSLLALAVSAWVKWRVIAMGAIFGIFLLPAGFGGVMDAILRTEWGRLLNLSEMFNVIVRSGFGTSIGGADFGIPSSAAWAVFTIVCIGSLELLHKRLRAFEVVRG